MKARKNFPLHVHVSALFVLLILAVGILISSIVHSLARNMLEAAASDTTQRMGLQMHDEVRKLLSPAEMAVKLLGQSVLVEAVSLPQRLERIGMVREAFDASPTLNALYIGYPNGDFFYVRQLQDDADRALVNAPPEARYIVQSIEHHESSSVGRFLLVDADLKVLKIIDRPGYPAEFDPRTRDWYRSANRTGKLIRTQPYVFFSNHKVGTSLAVASGVPGVVIGGDITLDTLGQALSNVPKPHGATLALMNRGGEVIADGTMPAASLTTMGPDQKPRLRLAREFGEPLLARLAMDIPASDTTREIHETITLDGHEWYASIGRLPLGDHDPLFLVYAIRKSDLLHGADRLRSISLSITLLIVLLAIPVIWLGARRITSPLQSLTRAAEAIRHFEFTQEFEIASRITEVNELGTTMNSMRRTIRRFLHIIENVAKEPRIDRLMPMLLTETMSAADADSGVLYLVDEATLEPASVWNARSMNGEVQLQQTTLDGTLSVIREAIRNGAPHTAYLTRDEVAGAKLTALAGDGGCHAAAVPLLNRQRHPVGVFLFLRSTPMESAQLSFVRTAAGLAAGVLESRELIKAQRDLFEAFIQLTAGAIDAKSPYTGGHCARVPELTKLLAKAACDTTTGPYREFKLNEQEWEALHVAAWLHDCGKVTTPEYVVDKATKLETIYNRIHEIRTRFEVLKRDAEIACLKAIAAGEDTATAQARRDLELAQLDDEFAFVATCNIGGESMNPAYIERLKQIGARTWERTLDDRIGISAEESLRKDGTVAEPLPVRESLLADKPEHRIERDERERIAADNPWGFRMTVPELLYHRGELHNLCVERGTLCEEERFKINEHIIQTLIMLSQLPFPKHLRQVPEIAGGHHERMDGKGYPKRLTRDQMSPLARMMAIADIFEALTAADRPYKKAKTLSESMEIMWRMKRGGHIDPELFDLFLTSGVYRDYADRFMSSEQIDEIDIERYVEAAEIG
ncbi:HD domain-containing phosphohydrolase [Paraburkholderia sp. ZP32-5]|uniref:HD domain-containing phosphohydrolase n=1 Tax=Paraburkholderia sp. ZP32-5 TaxID=2883245 RepID=UPI001F3DBF92|nr:HD domain-containing phosphohydrolase [Paraburkholderia sp. ZP32-5]